MSQLMKSISGIRGVVGDGLDPEQCARFAAAFGNYCEGGTVVLGRDTRPTGEMVRQAVIAGLMATGCTIVDVGVVPTPTVAIMVEELGADGGICITASHNPIQWNALKFFHRDGLFLDPAQAARHLELAEKGPSYADWSRMGSLSLREDALEIHVNRILALDLLDVPALRKRNFRVALDCVNGAGSAMLPHLLQELGCDVVKIGCDGSGRFFREAEPTPENITELSRVVAEGGFDLGFAVDPDADRLALVDAKGVPLGEEQTLALCARFVLAHRKGPVAVNVSSSAIMDDVCAEAGVPLHRTRVGEINVSIEMRKSGAVIGGEGNGGVILPDLHLGRDAPVGLALVLQYMLENGIGLRALREELPTYQMVKEKVELGTLDGEAAVNALRERFADRPMDETDGLKFLQPDGRSWVQVRRSNTEPILRIFAEAPTREAASALVNELRAALPTGA
ncbi:MAG: phosphoglucosamine mutase [Calditrichaeota bacterium]|nr:phosphoglucosamine mutase [Calditrichota bacterium]MCB9475098.1 phosphoglucosamine mutase [Candidatus Delongbacteria bacterium]